MGLDVWYFVVEGYGRLFFQGTLLSSILGKIVYYNHLEVLEVTLPLRLPGSTATQDSFASKELSCNTG